MAASHGSGSIWRMSCAAPSDTAGPDGRIYGRRRGRKLRSGRRQLRDGMLPRLAIQLPLQGQLNPAMLFSAPLAAVWLEIGFGAGEHLAWQAERHPDIGFIGGEVFENGVARLVGEIARHRLANIRLFTEDARLLVEHLLPDSIGRVFILFPDPWPKERHHKRRLVATPTLDRLARIMRPGAELRLATDDPGYCEWMLDHVTRHPRFALRAQGADEWRDRPNDWPATRYEMKARAAGRPPAFLRFVRRAE